MSLKNKLIKVVVVEPLGEINLGSIARLCMNFGVNELRLVSPRCNHTSTEAKKMAAHGKMFLENAPIFPNLLEAIKDCSRVIATCGRIDHGEIPLHSSENALKWFLSSPSNNPIAIIFGREDRGLSNLELQMAQKVITLSTSKIYPSLNLSHAAAIILHQLMEYAEMPHSSYQEKISNPAYPKEFNDFIEDAKELLLEIGFLHKHTAQARMTKIKKLLHKAEVSSEEISLIRGIVRQMRWFSKTKKN